MKQSSNLFIAAFMLLILALFIKFDAYPNFANFLRLFTFAAGIITLILAGRAERKEDREEKHHIISRTAHNYSTDFEFLNRKVGLNKIDKLIK